jgi:hypothetical protein
MVDHANTMISRVCDKIFAVWTLDGGRGSSEDRVERGTVLIAATVADVIFEFANCSGDSLDFSIPKSINNVCARIGDQRRLVWRDEDANRHDKMRR